MALFSAARTVQTGSAGAGQRSILVFTPAANRKLRINELSISGNGATSAAAAYIEASMNVSTGAGATTATSITTQKLEADSGTFASAVSHTFATGPTDPTFTAGSFLLIMGLNAYGGIYRWTARPNGEIVTRNVAGSIGATGAVFLYNNNSFTSLYSVHSVMDEL